MFIILWLNHFLHLIALPGAFSVVFFGPVRPGQGASTSAALGGGEPSSPPCGLQAPSIFWDFALDINREKPIMTSMINLVMNGCVCTGVWQCSRALGESL